MQLQNDIGQCVRACVCVRVCVIISTCLQGYAYNSCAYTYIQFKVNQNAMYVSDFITTGMSAQVREWVHVRMCIHCISEGGRQMRIVSCPRIVRG